MSFLFSFRLENDPKTHAMIAETEHRCSVVVLIFNSMDRRKVICLWFITTTFLCSIQLKTFHKMANGNITVEYVLFGGDAVYMP